MLKIMGSLSFAVFVGLLGNSIALAEEGQQDKASNETQYDYEGMKQAGERLMQAAAAYRAERARAQARKMETESIEAELSRLVKAGKGTISAVFKRHRAGTPAL